MDEGSGMNLYCNKKKRNILIGHGPTHGATTYPIWLFKIGLEVIKITTNKRTE